MLFTTDLRKAEQRAKRLTAMEGIYKSFFLADPVKGRPAFAPVAIRASLPIEQDAAAATPHTIKVGAMLQNGKQIYYYIGMQTELGKVRNAIADRFSWNLNMFRMIFEGKRVDYYHTAADLGLTNGGIIYIMMEQAEW